MVSRRVPSLIKSIMLVISFLTLGAGVGAPGNSLHAEECLSAPDSPSPQGTYWRYRLDWPTQRKCWYLGAPARSFFDGLLRRRQRRRFCSGVDTRLMVLRNRWTPLMRPRPHPTSICFRSTHRPRRASLREGAGFSSKAYRKPHLVATLRQRACLRDWRSYRPRCANIYRSSSELTWDSIDFRAATIHINRKKTGRQPRIKSADRSCESSKAASGSKTRNHASCSSMSAGRHSIATVSTG